VFIGCKTVYAERTQVNLPDHMDLESGCWALGGWFVFCDSSANVYRTQPGFGISEMCVEHVGGISGKGERPCHPFLCPSKQGFVLYAADELVVCVD
jgi:hypothetical protein